jgi:hypothetical protein
MRSGLALLGYEGYLGLCAFPRVLAAAAVMAALAYVVFRIIVL